MEWVVGFFAVLLIVFSRRFRIFAIGAVAVFGSYYFAQNLWDKHELAESRERVTLNELRLENVALRPISGRLWTLSGRAHNLSKDFDISKIEMTITIRDCASEECPIIGQQSEGIYQDIPAGQARDFDKQITILGVNSDEPDALKWEHAINYVEATEPK